MAVQPSYIHIYPSLVHPAPCSHLTSCGARALAAQDADAFTTSGNFKQGENKKPGNELTMGNANHQIGFEEFLNALALCGHIKFYETKDYKSKDSKTSTMVERVKGIFDMFALRLPGAGQSFLKEKAIISRML